MDYMSLRAQRSNLKNAECRLRPRDCFVATFLAMTLETPMREYHSKYIGCIIKLSLGGIPDYPEFGLNEIAIPLDSKIQTIYL